MDNQFTSYAETTMPVFRIFEGKLFAVTVHLGIKGGDEVAGSVSEDKPGAEEALPKGHT